MQFCGIQSLAGPSCAIQHIRNTKTTCTFALSGPGTAAATANRDVHKPHNVDHYRRACAGAKRALGFSSRANRTWALVPGLGFGVSVVY